MVRVPVSVGMWLAFLDAERGAARGEGVFTPIELSLHG